jgi:hypothetical protein
MAIADVDTLLADPDAYVGQLYGRSPGTDTGPKG